MAKNVTQNAARVANDAPTCTACGNPAYPCGCDETTGMCWFCRFPRSKAYFAQMVADTVVRREGFVVAAAARAAEAAEYAELLAA